MEKKDEKITEKEKLFHEGGQANEFNCLFKKFAKWKIRWSWWRGAQLDPRLRDFVGK